MVGFFSSLGAFLNLLGGGVGFSLGRIWVILELRVAFRILLIRVPYYVGDPTLENYPYTPAGGSEPRFRIFTI